MAWICFSTWSVTVTYNWILYVSHLHPASVALLRQKRAIFVEKIRHSFLFLLYLTYATTYCNLSKSTKYIWNTRLRRIAAPVLERKFRLWVYLLLMCPFQSRYVVKALWPSGSFINHFTNQPFWYLQTFFTWSSVLAWFNTLEPLLHTFLKLESSRSVVKLWCCIQIVGPCAALV